MSTLTPNYKLEKPESTDYYDVNVQNRNWEKIDSELKDIDDKKADLGKDGKILSEQLPPMNYDPAGSAAVVQKNLGAHTSNKKNPHGVTAEQVGADPKGSANAVKQSLEAHTGNKQNPHGVTAAQVGAYKKEEAMTAETAALFGLGVDAVPDDVLNQLGKFPNYHIWRNTEREPAGYTLGEEMKLKLFKGDYYNDSDTFYYALELTVDDSGEITNENKTSVSVSGGDSFNNSQVLKGKFVWRVNSNNKSDLELGKFYFIPEDATITRDGTNGIDVSKCKLVTPFASVYGKISYLFSLNRDAYQEGSDSKPAGYTLGDATTVSIKTASGDFAASIEYADSITVSDDGIASLVDASGTSVSNASSANSEALPLIKGKFIRQPKINSQKVYYVQDGASFSGQSSSLSLSNCKPVNSYSAIPANTIIEYMGQLGDKMRVVVGSYVGDGSNEWRDITVGFKPEALLLSSLGTIGDWVRPTGLIVNRNTILDDNVYERTFELTETGFRVKVYSSSSGFQVNVKNTPYDYIAIG